MGSVYELNWILVEFSVGQWQGKTSDLYAINSMSLVLPETLSLVVEEIDVTMDLWKNKKRRSWSSKQGLDHEGLIEVKGSRWNGNN